MTFIDTTYRTALPRRSVLPRWRSTIMSGANAKQLKSLDADVLKDIGITRAQADAEAKRPVWDAPTNWMR